MKNANLWPYFLFFAANLIVICFKKRGRLSICNLDNLLQYDDIRFLVAEIEALDYAIPIDGYVVLLAALDVAYNRGCAIIVVGKCNLRL